MDDTKKIESDKIEDKTKTILANVLSDEEKEKIKQRVDKELAAENTKRLSDEYAATLKAEAKKKALFKNAKPGETADGLVPVFIDLPKVSECIRLDGMAYYPGHTYNVTPQVREVLCEVMHKGQLHEDEVTGRIDSNRGRKKSNPYAQ